MSCDSVVSVTKIMVNIGKGQGQHLSAVSSNHQNDFKTFSCPMNNQRQRFWQKTTWATIMSQDDKTCIIAYLLICTKIGYLNVFQYRHITMHSNLKRFLIYL